MGLLDILDPETIAAAQAMNQPSAEQQRQARNNALMNAGFSMMMNNGGVNRQQALWNALGSGGMAGTGAYAQSISDSRQQNADLMKNGLALSKMMEDQRIKKAQQQFLNSDPNIPAEVRSGVIPYSEYWKRQNPEDQYKTVGDSLVKVGPQGAQSVFKNKKAPDGFEYAANDQLVPIQSYWDQKVKVAQAGKSDVNVSYGAPVAGVDSANNPVFFQPNKAGGAPAIVPGVKPADHEKPLTESQAKATAFLGQMKAAEDLLGQVGFNQSNFANQVDSRIAGGPLNMVASDKAQQVGQAQNQWSEAFLRFKTGAAATPEETALNNKTFFPQIGDSEKVIAQKKKMREQSANDMAIAAGKGAEKAGSVYQSKSPMKGQVVDGYKFKGGNPASPDSWEKQ